jgi:hypothetical protein
MLANVQRLPEQPRVPGDHFLKSPVLGQQLGIDVASVVQAVEEFPFGARQRQRRLVRHGAESERVSLEASASPATRLHAGTAAPSKRGSRARNRRYREQGAARSSVDREWIGERWNFAFSDPKVPQRRLSAAACLATP